MRASPIDLTCVPPNAGSCALTAAQKSATSSAASSSPWASVRAVKPAMSANRNVATLAAVISAGWLSSPPLWLEDPAGEQRQADDDVGGHAEGWVPRADVGRAVVVVMQPVPAAVRQVAHPQQHRGFVIRAEDPDGEEGAG